MEAIISLFFPKKCVGCRKIGSFLCSECILSLTQQDLICPYCYKFSLGGQTHPSCKRPLGLDGLWSFCSFQGAFRRAIIQLKYKDVQGIAKVLVDQLIEYWLIYQPLFLDRVKQEKGSNWVIVAVPLHSYRQNWRGFNQSGLIANDLAKRLGLQCVPLLKRTHLTKPQVKVQGNKRRQNLKNIFTLNTNIKIKELPKNVLLIDDVWTTGTTLKECCNTLKQNGVKQVWAITLAR